MSWEKTEAIINIRGFHLDIGNDHHRSIRDILVSICEYGSVSLRTTYIIETYSRVIPGNKYHQMVTAATESIKAMTEPISKFYVVIEGESQSVRHASIKSVLPETLSKLKELTQDFPRKVATQSYSDVYNALYQFLHAAFGVLQLIMEDITDTLCDNCNTIISNIDKALRLEGEQMKRGCQLIAAQIVNTIGVSLRERPGQANEAIADEIDEMASALCFGDHREALCMCRTVVESARTLFSSVSLQPSIDIITKEINKESAVPCVVMPQFQDTQMPRVVDNFLKEDQVREVFRTNGYRESIGKLCDAFDGMAAVLRSSKTLCRPISEVSQTLLELMGTTEEQNTGPNQGGAQNIRLSEVNRLCDQLLGPN